MGPPSSGHDSAPDTGSTPPMPPQATGDQRGAAARLVACRCLDTLGDDELHALLRHIHALLLDRPAAGADLSVHILRADEARLLALYRTLPAAARDEGLRQVERTLRSLAGGTVAAKATP